MQTSMDVLQLVECVLNHAAVLLMKTLALAQHLLWLMRLDTCKNKNITALFTCSSKLLSVYRDVT